MFISQPQRLFDHGFQSGRFHAGLSPVTIGGPHMSARLGIAAVVIVLLASLKTVHAAEPKFTGKISGLELAPQSVAGAAIFLFAYAGDVNGRVQKGIGWIAVKHDELPNELTDPPAAILGGTGEIYLGLRRFDIKVTGGSLELTDLNDPDVFDDDFSVSISVDIRNLLGQSGAHTFDGELSHVPPVPTIVGTLIPDGP